MARITSKGQPLSNPAASFAHNNAYLRVWNRFPFSLLQKTNSPYSAEAFSPQADRKLQSWKKTSWKTRWLIFCGIFFGGGFTVLLLWILKRRRDSKLLPTIQSYDPSDDYYDVCIIGAGVSGGTTAYYCAQYGRKVLLLEKQTMPREKCCAGAVSPQAQLHLKEMGVLHQILAENQAHWVNSGGFVSPSGYSFVGNPADIVASRTLAVQRSVLDTKIAEAAARQGTVVMDNCKVVDVLFYESMGLWQIRCEREGAEMSHVAKMLVAADGAASKISTKLNIVKEPADSIGSCIISTPCTGAPYQSLRADNVRFHPPQLSSCGYFVMLKHVNESFNLCTYISGNTSAQNLARINVDLINNDPSISSCLGSNVIFSPMKSALIRTGGVAKSYGNHFLCVGDAAGHVDPLSGEGIQYGMDAAKAASQVIAEGFRKGDLSERFLSRYQTQWRKMFASTFRSARYFAFLVHRYPLILDAAAIAIRRNGIDFLDRWTKAIYGEKSKLSLLRPDFLISITAEIIFQLLERRRQGKIPPEAQSQH
eukprot:TRINITY_DN2983_c0_g1_i2.p1 TRINITY_DN2983_c0_g1~~TRINITY_DN2983_c0_g1_i2.p1  ORF type:complete len:536 (+),score=57.04 TRINITY_DN2983_c0_g1_i2:125-1732(+)